MLALGAWLEKSRALFIMPFDVFKVGSEDKPYCVYKVNPDGKRTGQKLGCHTTPKKAHLQIAAIEAAEGKEMTDNGKEPVVELDEKQIDKKHLGEVVSMIPFGATSFDEVDEFMVSQALGDRVGELTRQFQTLTTNIMSAEDGDKAKGMDKLLEDFMDRVDDAMKASKEPSFLERVFGRKEALAKPEEIKSRFPDGAKRGFMVWKEGDRLRWMTVHSNKFRDRDSPPEIISSDAHKDFVKAVDAGEVEHPELWLWHIPGTRFGQSDWLAFDERGFMMASGFVDKGKEEIAEKTASLDVLVSHGMPIISIERDPEDETIITRYVSKEISPLPDFAAANELTDFTVLKENDMEISKEKEDFLEAAGMKKGEIAELDQFLDSKAQEAEGLEFKEGEVEAVAEPVEEEELVETIEIDEAVVEAIAGSSNVEIADAIVTAVDTAVAPIVKNQVELAKALQHIMKDDKEKIAEVAAATPTLSLAALVEESYSARKSGKTTIDKDDPLNKGPKEAKGKEDPITNMPGFEFVDQIVRDSEKKKE